MNVLFVCSRNKWRSPTAETIYKKRQGLHVKSAGTEPSAKNRVSAQHISWAEIIFVMEKKHREKLKEKFSLEMQRKKVIVLDIEDEYQYMDEELIEMIQLAVEPYL